MDLINTSSAREKKARDNGFQQGREFTARRFLLD